MEIAKHAGIRTQRPMSKHLRRVGVPSRLNLPIWSSKEIKQNSKPQTQRPNFQGNFKDPERHRWDSNLCGQRPMDFESISLATRTQRHKVRAPTHKSATIAACKSRACKTSKCFLGGLGVGVCLSSISHDNQIALQVVGERTSAWPPFRAAAKLLSRCDN